jgi:hypothetical protein
MAPSRWDLPSGPTVSDFRRRGLRTTLFSPPELQLELSLAMKPSTPDSDAAAAPGMPSEAVRTIVTLLLFIHLFAVGLAIMTSSESGASVLLRDIKERTPFLEPYLTQLWLDHGYDYYLMNDQNWDFRLEATVRYGDGHVGAPMILPDPDLWSGERRQRYQQLAGFMGNYIARATAPEASALDGERKLLLPEAIGGGFLRSNPKAESVSLKCVFHRGISREELRSENPRDRDPEGPQYFTSVGDMTIVLDRGKPTVFENLPSLEVSPVRRPKGAKPTTPASPTSDSETLSAGGK